MCRCDPSNAGADHVNSNFLAAARDIAKDGVDKISHSNPAAQAEELKGQAKGKANELGGRAKGAAKEAEGKAKGAAEEFKQKL